MNPQTRRLVSLTAAVLIAVIGFGMAEGQTPFQIQLFIDDDTLTVYVPELGNVSLEGLAFQVQRNGQTEVYRFEDFSGFELPLNNIPTPICFHLRESRALTPLPVQCPPAATLTQNLNPANVFWHDRVRNVPLVVVLTLYGAPFQICPSGINNCIGVVVQPTYTPTLKATNAPTLTSTPIPTLIPTATYTPTPIPVPVLVLLEMPSSLTEVEGYWSVSSDFNRDQDDHFRIQTSASFLVFERGFMIWRGDSGYIWVLLQNGEYRSYSNDFIDQLPQLPPSYSPPSGFTLPTGGFAILWDNVDGLRDALGWSIGTEFWYVADWWISQDDRRLQSVFLPPGVQPTSPISSDILLDRTLLATFEAEASQTVTP